MSSLSGMGLIVMVLVTIVVPGVIYNNLTSSGLVVAASQPIGNCDNNLITCQITGNVGCQSNPAYCNLSGQTVSFLSPSSPWTSLLSGDFLGFFTGLFSGSASARSVQNQAEFTNCYGVNPYNQTTNAVFIWLCTSEAFVNSATTSPFFCPEYLAIGNGNNSIFNVYGFSGTPTKAASCQTQGPLYPQTFLAYPLKTLKYSLLSTGTYNYTVSLPLRWPPHVVGEYWNNATYGGTGQHIWGTNLYVASSAASTQSGGTINLPGWWGAFGFVIAIILIIMSLGITLSGSLQALASGVSASVGVNDTGARLAQTVGLALLLYLFLTSEFGGWLTLFPYSIPFVLTSSLAALYFFGMWQAVREYFD